MTGSFPIAAWMDHLGRLVQGLLAVVGAVAVGALLTEGIVRFLGRFVFRKNVPLLVRRLLRTLGGIAAGLLVWLLVFGGGGGGFGFGGGSGFGLGGTGEGNGSPSTSDGKEDAGKEKPEVTDQKPPLTKGESLRIVMLGGARVPAGERFYVLEGEKAPRNLAELLDAIKERKQQKPDLKGIEIVIYPSSVAESHAAVVDLKKRAVELDLAVQTTKPGTDAP